MSRFSTADRGQVRAAGKRKKPKRPQPRPPVSPMDVERRSGRRTTRQAHVDAIMGRNAPAGPTGANHRRGYFVANPWLEQAVVAGLRKQLDRPDISYSRRVALEDAIKRYQMRSLQALDRGPGSGLENFASLFVPESIATHIPGGAYPAHISGLDWGLGALVVLPIGRIGGLLGRGVGLSREFTAEGLRASIPAAGSRTGRVIERAADKLTPAGRKAKRAAAETERSIQIARRLQSSSASALERLGRRMGPHKQYALFLHAEGSTAQEAIDFAKRRIDNIRHDLREERIDPKAAAQQIKAHRLHIRLAEGAKEFMDGNRIASTAPANMREAARLIEENGALRETMLQDWAQQFGRDPTPTSRIHAPALKRLGVENLLAGSSEQPTLFEDLPDVFTGRAYLEHQYGTPGRSLLQNAGRISGAWMNRQRRGVVSMLARDPHLMRTWTGALMDSGFLRTDATRLSAQGVYKAMRVNTILQKRRALLKAAQSADQINLDKVEDYIPIKIDPSKTTSMDVKRFMARLDEGALSAREAEQISDHGIDQLLRELFPSGRPVSELLADDNILWVSKQVFDELAVDPNAFKFVGSPKLGKVARAAGVLGRLFSDLQKFAILYANPAYGAPNLLGNVALNLMQQGVLMGRNVKRAFAWTRRMRPENVAAVDVLMGRGISLAQAPETPILRKAMQTYTNALHDIVDLVPRRTAFIHEAAKEGINTSAELEALLDAARMGREDAFQKVERITRRANDAIIDYDRLSPMERHVVARLIFVYPWLKGSARYTARFPLEHPVQAAAIAYAGYKQQEANRELGDKPFYAQTLVKIPEAIAIPEWVPYLGAKDIKMPFPGEVVDPTAFFPFSTIPEAIQAAYGTFKPITEGKPSPNVISYLNPAASTLVSAITGRDLETGRPIEGDFKTRLSEVAGKTIAPVRVYKDLSKSKRERDRKLYPRSDTELYLQLVLGRAAPHGFNPKAAAEIVKKPVAPTTRARLEARQQQREIERVWRQATGDPVPPEVARGFRNYEAVRVAEAQLIAKLKRENKQWLAHKEASDDRQLVLTDKQKLAVRMRLIERDPALREQASQLRQAIADVGDNPQMIHELVSLADAVLGLHAKSDFVEYVHQLEQLKAAA
jgi:hypothetical protein